MQLDCYFHIYHNIAIFTYIIVLEFIWYDRYYILYTVICIKIYLIR
jgi:hypothetical protein